MIKSKLTKVTILFLFIIGISSIAFAISFKDSEKTIAHFPEKSNNELISYIQKYNNLVEYIRINLQEKGYGFVLDYAILPDENIELIIKLPDKKIKNHTKKDIRKIAVDVIIKNNFDPESFQIRTESYYASSIKEVKNSSIRLSYNDLLGYILNDLEQSDYGTFSLQHEFSPENIRIIINVPTETNINKKQDIEKIALNIIKKNNFDPNIFQIDVISSIIIE